VSRSTNGGGRGRVTIMDVARRAGVSKGAVSLALNGRPGVSDATRRRILAAAESLSWQPSVRARALSESRALAVGLVLARPAERLASDPFFGHLLAGIETTLATEGYVLVLSVVGDAATEVQTYRRLARDGRMDGVLLTDIRFGDPRYELVTELGLEAVVIGHPDPTVPLPTVDEDERSAILAAVGALVDAGHERIGHVSGPRELVHAAHRRAVWQESMLELGLRVEAVEEGDYTGEGGARATRRLLARRPRPTAIVYANDLMAISGIEAARAMGIEVPGELSVVGFDDIPFARHMAPALTTIRQDFTRTAAAAARVLLARLRDEPAALPALPPAFLVMRDSVARAPGAV
jgi:DNA-binding LacI/PurR family transcriptional regulator